MSSKIFHHNFWIKKSFSEIFWSVVIILVLQYFGKQSKIFLYLIWEIFGTFVSYLFLKLWIFSLNIEFTWFVPDIKKRLLSYHPSSFILSLACVNVVLLFIFFLRPFGMSVLNTIFSLNIYYYFEIKNDLENIISVQQWKQKTNIYHCQDCDHHHCIFF